MRYDLLVHLENARVVVAGVAAEKLIGALAGENDLYVFAREARHKVQRDARRVGKRLIHVVLHGGNRVPEFLARNKVGVVLNADFAAKLLRPADLVVFLAEVKAYGKGLLVGEVGGYIA